MSLTTTVTGTNSIGIAPATINWPQEEYSRSHSFNCTQVENGWILNFNNRHYVFENSSDMIAKMNALLVEKALAR